MGGSIFGITTLRFWPLASFANSEIFLIVILYMNMDTEVLTDTHKVIQIMNNESFNGSIDSVEMDIKLTSCVNAAGWVNELLFVP